MMRQGAEHFKFSLFTQGKSTKALHYFNILHTRLWLFSSLYKSEKLRFQGYQLLSSQ